MEKGLFFFSFVKPLQKIVLPLNGLDVNSSELIREIKVGMKVSLKLELLKSPICNEIMKCLWQYQL